MSSKNIKQRQSRGSAENQVDDYILPKLTNEEKLYRKSSKLPEKKPTNKLFDLVEKNEDIISDDDDIQNISFSLSNCDDMNDFLDNFSNKSDEQVELEYENTTNEEGFALIEDFLKENTKQILNSKKGFDEDAKKMAGDFYSDLVKNVVLQKEAKKVPHYLDKTKNTYYLTKSESITSEEQTLKFKNDLVGQTFENKQNDGVSYVFGKINSINSKTKSLYPDKNSSQSIEDENDKIISIKKKKKNQ